MQWIGRGVLADLFIIPDPELLLWCKKNLELDYLAVNVECLFTQIKHISRSGQYKKTPTMTIKDHKWFWILCEQRSKGIPIFSWHIVQQYRLIKATYGIFLQHLQYGDLFFCLLKTISWENLELYCQSFKIAFLEWEVLATDEILLMVT